MRAGANRPICSDFLLTPQTPIIVYLLGSPPPAIPVGRSPEFPRSGERFCTRSHTLPVTTITPKLRCAISISDPTAQSEPRVNPIPSKGSADPLLGSAALPSNSRGFPVRKPARRVTCSIQLPSCAGRFEAVLSDHDGQAGGDRRSSEASRGCFDRGNHRGVAHRGGDPARTRRYCRRPHQDSGTGRTFT